MFYFKSSFKYHYRIVSFSNSGIYLLDENSDKPFFYRLSLNRFFRTSFSSRFLYKSDGFMYLALRKPIDFSNPLLYQ